MASQVECQQVGPGVYRCFDRIVNWYLVADDTGVTLVDVAYPRSWGAIQESVRSIGRSLQDVRAVLVTHGHADHFGAAEDARSELGVPVRAHERDIPRMTGEEPGGAAWAVVPRTLRQVWRRSAWVYLLHETREGFLKPKWVKEIVPVADGEVLDVPGRPTALFLPGHTLGHSGYHLAESGVLFSGDELVTWDPLKGRPGPCLMPRELNDDHAEAVRSLDRLDGVTAEMVLPGHGKPWFGSVERAVELARMHHARS
jgi:glyoxylase-like metal-dependent hydrolase (beta-lactamase superfamily II)